MRDDVPSSPFQEVLNLDLDTLWTSAGAAAWGTCAYADLHLHMKEHAQARAEALCPAPAGVYVAAFPYYAGKAPGNLSLYARGEDYHTALTRRLEPVCAALHRAHPFHKFVPLVDNSPLPERQAAALAGLGLRGKNGLVILPPWGSWLFLATILTDLPLPSAPVPSPDCIDCGACVAACPSKALRSNGFDLSRCLSDLTQRKGELTAEEADLLRRHDLIWGCDTCQMVCPYNQEVPTTPLPEFREQLLSTLTAKDVENSTRRLFAATFPGRAFTWRGPGVLERNLRLKGDEEKAPALD